MRVMLPDQVWPAFEKWHQTPDPVAWHGSILLLALARGQLGRITAPIHLFLLDGESPKPTVRQQYLADLRETWMLAADALERHRGFRRFFGKVAELKFAEWLEGQGWEVKQLEAIQDGPDVVATSEGTTAAFEVKYIGSEDQDFGSVLRSIAGETSGGSVSLPAPVNYLLFRAYEAAKQLSSAGTTLRRIAVIAIDETTWWRFGLQLQHGWVDWADPKFLPADAQWDAFLQKQAKQPATQADLAQTLTALDELWVLRLNEYTYIEAFVHAFAQHG